MDCLAANDRLLSIGILAASVAVGSVGFAAALLGIHWLTHILVMRMPMSDRTRERFADYDALTSAVWLVLFSGAYGVQFIMPLIACVIVAWIALKAISLYMAASKSERAASFSSLPWLSFLFLISGFAALIYQIVWQRELFAAFGVNIESITIVVSLFMFGLGVGSVVGGWMSKRFPESAPWLFLISELGIGAFGVVSLPLIAIVSNATIDGSIAVTALAIYGLLCMPTMLMGATLPILVGHLYRHYRNVGRSVGILYCINTLGSAIACFLTADLLFVFFGQQTSVLVAAGCNIIVGVLVFSYARRIAANQEITARL